MIYINSTKLSIEKDDSCLHNDINNEKIDYGE
jgi:hypothetical protein